MRTMKKSWFMLTLTALCVSGADPTLTKDQREHAIELRQDSRKEFLATVEGLS